MAKRRGTLVVVCTGYQEIRNGVKLEPPVKVESFKIRIKKWK